MSALQIRPATVADAAAVDALERAALPDAGATLAAEAIGRPDSIVFVAVDSAGQGNTVPLILGALVSLLGIALTFVVFW